jgi:hypothetical protein
VKPIKDLGLVHPIREQKPRVQLQRSKPLVPWAPPVVPFLGTSKESSRGLVARTYGLDQSVYDAGQEPRGPHKPAKMSREWKLPRGGWHANKQKSK